MTTIIGPLIKIKLAISLVVILFTISMISFTFAHPCPYIIRKGQSEKNKYHNKRKEANVSR